MKIKDEFILRKCGAEYLVVAVGEAGKQFNSMISLNEAGAWLWKQMKEDVSEEALIEKMCSRYDDLDRETAAADLKDFLESVKAAVTA